MNTSINEIVDGLFNARQKIFEHVGYTEQWNDMPFEDSRDNYWAIDDELGAKVMFSPSREALVYWLEGHDDEYGPHGNKLFDNEIYGGRHDTKHGIHRGAELTMICVDTHTDGNKFFQLFRNDHEVKPEPKIKASNGVINGEPMLGLVPTLTSLLDPPDVVFVRATGSDDTGDGTTEEMAYHTIERAMKNIADRPPSKSHCVIDFDGAGEVGRRFLVRRNR